MLQPHLHTKESFSDPHKQEGLVIGLLLPCCSTLMKHHLGCVCIVGQSSAGAGDCPTMLRSKIDFNLAKGSLADTFSLLHVQHRCLCFFAQKPSPDVSFPRTKLTLTKNEQAWSCGSSVPVSGDVAWGEK